jgi:hypothetical protein
VYVLVRPQYGFDAGEPMIEASLIPGALIHLINTGDAVEVNENDWRTSLEAGRQAQLHAEHEARAANEKAQATGQGCSPEELQRAEEAPATNDRHAADADKTVWNRVAVDAPGR